MEVMYGAQYSINGRSLIDGIHFGIVPAQFHQCRVSSGIILGLLAYTIDTRRNCLTLEGNERRDAFSKKKGQISPQAQNVHQAVARGGCIGRSLLDSQLPKCDNSVYCHSHQLRNAPHQKRWFSSRNYH